MAHPTTASGWWARLDGERSKLMQKAELCCNFTVPRLFEKTENVSSADSESTNDFQSVGALCVNHMANRTMLAMFPPSRPFFVPVAPDDISAAVQQAGASTEDLQAELLRMAQDCSTYFENSGQRPMLTEATQHLIATGNCLLIKPEEEFSPFRVLNLRYYCVKRTRNGEVRTLVIREQMEFIDLDVDAQDALAMKYQADTKVFLYTLVERQPAGNYVMSQWVDDNKLPDEFSSRYKSKKDLPFHVLTWNRGSGKDYGTGLVEDYLRDFTAMSALGQATAEGAVACAQSRWFVDPASTTQVTDLNNSQNNQALPGTADSVINVAGGNPAGMQIAQAQSDKIEQRLRQAFMMTSGVIRNAERVTKYELMQLTRELDTQHGGSYSALANTIQSIIAEWTLEYTPLPDEIRKIKFRVATGTDAMSRSGDVDNLRLAFEDLAATNTLPQNLQQMIDWQRVFAFVGNGRQVPLASFLMNQEAMQQQTDQAVQTQADAAFATSAAQAAGNSIAQ